MLILILTHLTFSSPQVSYQTIRTFSFENAADFVISPGQLVFDQQRIYILDEADRAIKVFDQDLNIIFKINRRGQGPGDFQLPAAFHLSPDFLWVFDRIRGTLMAFDRQGDFNHEVALSTCYSAQFTSQGIVLQDPFGDKPFQFFNLAGEKVLAFGENLSKGNMANMVGNMFQFTITDKERILFAVSRNGKSLQLFDLDQGKKTQSAHLDIHDQYAAESQTQFNKARGSMTIINGMPVNNLLLIDGEPWLFVEDENNDHNPWMIKVSRLGQRQSVIRLPITSSHVLSDRDHVFLFHEDAALLEQIQLEKNL